MKKISFLAALLCASMISFAQEPVYDVNFALASNGSSATASSGNAAAAIDGDEGTRWESAQTDDEWFLLDMGQARTFSRVNIKWEGAYAKQFALTYSSDGESWSNLYTETNLTKAGWQTIDVTETTARYIKYQGIERATQWGQSFFEFQVLLPGVSVLTSIQLTAPSRIAKVNEGIALTAKAFDQNGTEMEAEISYEVAPADAGAVVNGTYVPAKIGDAAIVAKSGEIVSDTISVFGYEGSNLALSTNIDLDNKAIAQSDYLPSGTNAFFAIDGNDGSVYQGSPTNGTAGDEASRTYDVWFVVDLGANYDIDLITIHFEGACSQDYHVDFATDTTNWALGYNYVGTAGINGRTDVLTATELDNNLKVRYVRFWSTKAGTEWGMKMFEFQVYGREWVPSGDTEAPVMVSASLESKTWNSAVIAVSATDNNEVTKYHVVDATNAVDVKLTPNDNKITVSGLSANTAYNFTITALDASLNESANSKSVAVTTDAHALAPDSAAVAPTYPANQVNAIYSATYSATCNFQDWGSGTTATDTEFGKKFVLANGGYFGLDGFLLNCLLMEKLHADIWIDADATLRLVPIYGGAGLSTDDTHGKIVSLTGGQWNTIDLDLATDYAGLDLSSIFQFKIDNAANLTFWLDNLYFYRAEPLDDNEAPTNVQASVASTGYFSVTLAVSAEDNSGAVSFNVLQGELVVANGGGASGATVNITIPNLQANNEYSFSVVALDANDNMAEPVAVQATTIAAPAPAPVPTYEAEKVQGVFTDIYTDLNMGIQGWYAEPAISIGLLSASSEAICITPNNTPGSCFGLAFPATDITAYNALEMDVYPMAEDAVLDIQVIGIGEGSTTYNLTANQWNHISLSIAGNTKTNCEQIGFYNCNNLKGVAFVQNVLFVTTSGEGIEDIETSMKAVKVIENGQLFIIKNGVKYNALGVEVR